jgi:hypothetical protein
MQILAQFLLRLSFGLAVGMALTSPRHVSSGFFRNHLLVTLGLNSFAALVTYSAAPDAFWFSVAAAVASYFGSVLWLYEKQAAGMMLIILVVLFSMIGSHRLAASLATLQGHHLRDRYIESFPDAVTIAPAGELAARSRFMGLSSGALGLVSNISSGLLLGLTTAAMLLGHWYLNSPGMQLAPLRRLLAAAGAAVLLQALVSSIGFACEVRYATTVSTHLLLFLLLRWSFGLAGVAVLLWMASRTLKIPNTQSATGILYVAVIGVFVGELTGLLLSNESAFPL